MLETYLEREAPGLSAAKEPQELIDAVGAGLLPDVDRAAITGEYATALIASMNRSVKNGIWGWFDDDMAFFRDWGFSLDGIDVPVALWQGKQDKMVPFAHGEWMAAHVPNARPHLLEDQGHLSLAVASFPQILDDLLEHAHGVLVLSQQVVELAVEYPGRPLLGRRAEVGEQEKCENGGDDERGHGSP